MGRDALTDRCGGGGGGGATKPGGGGSITSAGCVGCGGGNAGRLGGGGEVDVVGFGMGRGTLSEQPVGGGGDIMAALCRRTGCGRLMFIVDAAAAAAMTIGSGEVTEVVLVLPVAVVVGVGVVTVVLRSVSSTPMKDTAVARRGRGAGGVFLALTAVHDVNIPGGHTQSGHAPGTTSHRCQFPFAPVSIQINSPLQYIHICFTILYCLDLIIQ